jgi:tetratricopeptide (TPR) repeat protein
LGKIYEAEKKYNKALYEYEKELKINPDYKPAKESVSEIRKLLKHYTGQSLMYFLRRAFDPLILNNP